MMQYPAHLKPEHQFLRVVYAGVLTIAEPIETFSVWCITGTAAILGLLVVNIDSVSKIISASGLRWGIVLLTVSMLAGAVAKQYGIVVKLGIALIDAMYAEIETPGGAAAMDNMTVSTEELQEQMAAPFLWPFKNIMLRAARRGAADPIAGEKRFVKMLCVQMYASYIQMACAAAGLLLLAFGIR